MRRLLILLLLCGGACKDDKPGPSCPRGTLGCPCDSGTCDGLVCADDECRTAVTCDACVAHQRCTAETATTDAVCLAECELGWTWDGSACDPECTQEMVEECALENRACLEDGGTAGCADCLVGYLEEGTTCRAVVTCDDCTLELRECTTPAGDHSDAACGGCLSGHTEDTGDCRAVYTCLTLPEPCTKNEVCIEATSSRDAVCANCPDCDGTGVTGDNVITEGLEPKCICVTEPGYFYSVASSDLDSGVPCDEDGDGWVRVSARDYIDEQDDLILAANARCVLQMVNSFVLQNEAGERFTLTSTEDTDLPVPLYESVRNDRLGPVAGRPTYHDTTGAGRLLHGNELNGLTKACVEVNADYNDNDVPDVREWGRPGDGSQVSGADEPVYARYSYFLATHRGWFVPDAPIPDPAPRTVDGAYHVREKDRTPGAADAFALRYDPGVSNFWQDCPRARDAWYSTQYPPITLDFASVSGPAQRSDTWTGMMHHSQFKCVQIASTMPTVPEEEPHIHTLASVAAHDWYLNDCHAPDPGSSSANFSGNSPYDPELSCQLVPSVTGLPQLVWASVDIEMEIANYERGCVVQCEGQPYLCPGGADPCWWMCGDFAGSESPELTGGDWILRGEVPVPGLTEDVEDGMTGGGWTLKARR